MARRRHPIKIRSHVWCDYHTTLHGATRDFYNEGGESAQECRKKNWRPVYVLGDYGEEF